MIPDVPPYRARLREAQNLFRTKEQVPAYKAAQSLHMEFPQAEDVHKFYDAVARSLLATAKQQALLEDHEMAIYYARLLVGNARQHNSALKIILEASRTGNTAQDRAMLLYDICRDDPENVLYWGEIALCIKDLSVDDVSVGIGFATLRVLPGHDQALLGLTQLLAPHVSQTSVREIKDQFPTGQLAALLERLATYVTDDADRDARRRGYFALRRDVLDGRFDQDGAARNLTRIAVEYAIHDVEKAIAVDPSDPEKAPDPWSLLDPTSRHYILDNAPPVNVVFPKTARKYTRPSKGLRSISRRLVVMLSLWIHGLNGEAAQDRIGYAWLVMDPLIQIMVVCAVPLFIQPEIVYDMAVFPFSVIGACFWLTFRTAAVGAMTGGGVLKPQLEHPAIRRFDIMVARALNALFIYFIAGFFLLGASVFLRLTDGPQNFPLLVAGFFTSWVMGISFGIIANSLIALYPGVRRLIVYGLRFIALISGLFYIPEQLPERVAEVILYNPLLQLIQLARTHWFHEYTTMDADVPYILFWALSMSLLALVCLVVDDNRPDTVRA